MKSLTKQEEQILLVIYQLNEDAYLVNIREKLKEITGKYLDVGTIYVPLNRLYKNGYLDTYHGEPTAVRGGKAIKYYKLTKQGLEVLSQIKTIHDRLWDGFRTTVIKNA
ncbi:PadR family transcriptional regulator [candidate division KSB1 bacterium]